MMMKEHERKKKIVLGLLTKLSLAIKRKDTDEARSVCKRITRLCDESDIKSEDSDSTMLFFIAKSFEHDKKQKETAMKIYEMAARSGDRESAWILGNYYYPRDKLTSFKWHQRAADLGHDASAKHVEKNKDTITRLTTLKFLKEDSNKNEKDECEFRGIVF